MKRLKQALFAHVMTMKYLTSTVNPMWLSAQKTFTICFAAIVLNNC